MLAQKVQLFLLHPSAIIPSLLKRGTQIFIENTLTYYSDLLNNIYWLKTAPKASFPPTSSKLQHTTPSKVDSKARLGQKVKSQAESKITKANKEVRFREQGECHCDRIPIVGGRKLVP
jgi:hypothetical protein